MAILTGVRFRFGKMKKAAVIILTLVIMVAMSIRASDSLWATAGSGKQKQANGVFWATNRGLAQNRAGSGFSSSATSDIEAEKGAFGRTPRLPVLKCRYYDKAAFEASFEASYDTSEAAGFRVIAEEELEKFPSDNNSQKY
ncbi:MAG: hypothetical protein N2376_11700, partial [Clostridia bacterium]|nr:hypothetical protein [Clostridia bacterium]